MSRRGVTYEPSDPKYRGSDLKHPAKDLVDDFVSLYGLRRMIERMMPAFPDDGPEARSRLIGWADHATGGLYSVLRHHSHVYAEYFRPVYSRTDTATFRFSDPTSGSLMFGLMRGRAVVLTLSGSLPPPVPSIKAMIVPASWVDDEPVAGWVRTVLKVGIDEAALRALLVRVVDATRLRPWAVLAAFSPAFAGYYGHRFRPTPDLWRCVREPDIAFVERLLPELLLRAKHPMVDGQLVTVEGRGS